jgi:hypothetical protein
MCRPDDYIHRDGPPDYDDPTIFPPIVDGLPTWDSEPPPVRPYIDMVDVVDPKQRSVRLDEAGAPPFDSTPYVDISEASKRVIADDLHASGITSPAIELSRLQRAANQILRDMDLDSAPQAARALTALLREQGALDDDNA